MKKFYNFLLSSDKFLLSSVLCSLFSILSISTTLLLFRDRLPNRLPLLYSLSWGEHQLVSKEQFLILPATVLLITLINLFISFYIHQAHFVLKRILVFSLLLINFIILITAFEIVSIFL